MFPVRSKTRAGTASRVGPTLLNCLADILTEVSISRLDANNPKHHEMRPAEVTGVVLAGGLSRRMGGVDKPLLELAGKSMLSHVLDRLSPQVGRTVINANGDASRFASFGLPVVADTVAGFVGPLAGILAGMRWSTLHAPAANWIATVAGDAPMLPPDLVARLAAAAPGGAIALARSQGGVHPVIGLWPVALADDLEAALNEGVRKVLIWVERHAHVAVDFPAVRAGSADIDPFFNANTPQELDTLRAMLAKAGA